MEVETHLPTQRNIKVNNGKEETDMALVRIPFTNDASATIFSDDGILQDNIELTTKAYVGRVNFVHKTTAVQQWNTLTSSFEQRIFRFQLYCVYNVYGATGYTQTKTKVPFTEDGDWDLSVRFVSKL